MGISSDWKCHADCLRHDGWSDAWPYTFLKCMSLSCQEGDGSVEEQRDKTNFIKVVGQRGGYLDVASPR